MGVCAGAETHEQPGSHRPKLIRATVAVIEDSGPPPDELRMLWRCDKYHALPKAGGVLDQDAKLMHDMDVVGNIYHALSRYRNAKGRQIHSLSDPERKTIKALRDAGMI